jgi:2-dehydro-3-deoxyphosphogluconate aldolase / (4S)-4-hydroxy-2-oxoglutarate aldolase
MRPDINDMTKKDILHRIFHIGIIPIARFNFADKAFPVGDALIKGGIPVLEISLSIPGSLAVIEKTAKRFQDTLLLGAGTVLDPKTVRDAISAGAQFIVSPNTNVDVIKECLSADVPCFPGALTPTEIALALQAGADAIKVFPCSAMGGPAYIRSLKAPFPNSLLIPCGGVGAANAAEYISAGSAALFTGTSLVNADVQKPGGFETLAKNASQLAGIVRSSRKNAA